MAATKSKQRTADAKSKKTAAKTGKTNANTPGNSEAVNAFMEQLSHPLKAEMEQVRSIIKSAHSGIKEQVKWNAPSFFYREDLVTFNPRLQTAVHLVFHNPEIVNIKSALLEGDYKDRRMMYLKDQQSITTRKAELQKIMQQLVNIVEKGTIE